MAVGREGWFTDWATEVNKLLITVHYCIICVTHVESTDQISTSKYLCFQTAGCFKCVVYTFESCNTVHYTYTLIII